MNNEHFNSEQEILQDAQLRQLLRAHLPVASPSSTLQERVASLATSCPQVPSQNLNHRHSRALRFSLTVATVALFIMGGSIMWPRVMAQQALARVEEAISKVSTMHCVMFRIENGKPIKEGEKWFDRGKWRSEFPEDAKFSEQGLTSIYVDGTTWSYRKYSNTVTVNKNAQPRGSEEHFTLTDLIEQIDKPTTIPDPPQRTVTFQGTTTQGGRTLKRVQVDIIRRIETSKILLLVDAETDLPVSADIHARGRRGEMQGLITYSYNQPLSPELFKPNFPPSARLVDFVEEMKKAELNRKAQLELGRKPPVQGDAAILSLEVNSHGSVFLAYRVNKSAFTARGYIVFISDSLGTVYRSGGQLTKASALASEAPTSEVPSPIGQWWIPVKPHVPGQKWQPRTFTVDFKLLPDNLRSGQSFSEDSLKGIKFSLPTTETTGTVVPPLVKKLGDSVSEQQIIEKEQENPKTQ